jgi:alkylhydroperoxidase family enzyme
MPRLRQVSKDSAPESVRKLYERMFGERDPVASPGTATGTPGNWWTVFALVPDCLDHAVRGFRFYRGEDRALGAKLRELGQTRAGWARGSQFVFSQHCKAMRHLGFSEEQISAIPAWSTASCFSEVERLVLAYSDCLVQDGGRTPDPLFEALRKHLSDEAILELTYITCTYAMHATICRALRLEYDDVDERVREIPAPESGAAAGDVMNMVDR